VEGLDATHTLHNPDPLRVIAEGRRQKAEGRRQKAEGRRQKAEGRRQKLTTAGFELFVMS